MSAGKHTHRYNKSTYDGDYLDGKRHGTGKQVWDDGACYVGDWVQDRKHGVGEWTFASGIMYQGDIAGNSLEGKGTMKYVNGDQYAGGFSNGSRQGQGRCTFANGDFYEGGWHLDKEHGQGTWTFSGTDAVSKDGSTETTPFSSYAVYVGAIYSGRLEGQGVLTMKNGDVYEGEFHASQMTGIGHYTYHVEANVDEPQVHAANADTGTGTGTKTSSSDTIPTSSNSGGKYSGEIHQGKRSGEVGKMRYANGDVYKGSWYHDQKSGSGEYTHAGSGKKWVGLWHKDQRMGQGKLHDKDGSVIAEGVWMGNGGPLTEEQLQSAKLQHLMPVLPDKC